MKDNRKLVQSTKKKPGRPITWIIRLDATPEEVAQRMFGNAKPPDPSIRVRYKPK